MNIEKKDELQKALELIKTGGVGERLEAVKLLRELNRLEAIPLLRKLIAGGHPEIRPAAEEALAEIQSRWKKDEAFIRERIERASETVRADSSSEEKGVLSSKEKSKNINLVLLEECLSHDDPRTRMLTARQIGEVKDEKIAGVLKARLSVEYHPFVIATLLSALGRAGDRGDAETAIRFLDHKDERVRANALEALFKLDRALALEHAKRFINDPDPRTRRNAVRIIEIQSKKSEEAEKRDPARLRQKMQLSYEEEKRSRLIEMRRSAFLIGGGVFLAGFIILLVTLPGRIGREEKMTGEQKGEELPLTLEKRIEKARALTAEGLYSQAVSEYESLLQECSDSSEIYFELVKVLVESGRTGDALKRIREAEEKGLHTSGLSFLQATALLERGDSKRAIMILKRLAGEKGEVAFRAREKLRSLEETSFKTLENFEKRAGRAVHAFYESLARGAESRARRYFFDEETFQQIWKAYPMNTHDHFAIFITGEVIISRPYRTENETSVRITVFEDCEMAKPGGRISQYNSLVTWVLMSDGGNPRIVSREASFSLQDVADHTKKQMLRASIALAAGEDSVAMRLYSHLAKKFTGRPAFFKNYLLSRLAVEENSVIRRVRFLPFLRIFICRVQSFCHDVYNEFSGSSICFDNWPVFLVKTDVFTAPCMELFSGFAFMRILSIFISSFTIDGFDKMNIQELIDYCVNRMSDNSIGPFRKEHYIADLLFLKAEEEIREGKDAENTLLEIARSYPFYTRAIIELAAIQEKKGKTGEAARFLEQAAGVTPYFSAIEARRDPVLYSMIAQGEELMANGSPEKAVQVFRSISEEHGENNYLRLVMARAYLEAGEREEVLKILQPLMENKTVNAPAMAIKALALQALEGDSTQAVELAERAYKNSPGLLIVRRAYDNLLVRDEEAD